MSCQVVRFLCCSLLLLCACPRKRDGGEPDGAGRGGAGPVLEERRLRVELSLEGTRLRVGAFDGERPVMTDLWLYTLSGGKMSPFSAFQDPPAKRRSRRRLLPCTLGGAPSGLSPCDQGEENGVMTDGIREWRVKGERRSAINGKTEIVLHEAPRQPILVVAAVEDQRYAGAAAIRPDGAAAPVPAGVGEPTRHRLVTYGDVAPVLRLCQACHVRGGPSQHFPLGSYEDVVSFDFGYEEERRACAAAHAQDAVKRAACEAAIQEGEYMVEPGAPALSPLLHRTRPDEQRSISPLGLRWYGAQGRERFADKGDRRMPPQNITPEPADDRPDPNYFDLHPAEYQLLFDWVAQGAPRGK